MIKNNETNKNESFIGHLTELRSRLLKTFIFLILTFVVCYYFSENIYAFLVKPYSTAILENNLGLEVHAGHGLEFKTTKIQSKIKFIQEFNIGHFLIGESIFYGLSKIIKKFKRIIGK